MRGWTGTRGITLAIVLGTGCAPGPNDTTEDTAGPTTGPAGATTTSDATTGTGTTTAGTATQGTATQGTATQGTSTSTSTSSPTTTGPGPTTTDNGTTDDTATSTGGADAPELALLQITDENRHHDTMMGGWGPHLRGVMRDAQDQLWFTVDQGPDVLNNDTIRYFTLAGDAWTEVAQLAHADGVQQNSASVLSGDFIYTYSVNIGQSVLEECYFDTTDPDYRACNTILISNQPYATPPSSNYVGAAVSPTGARVVWFTVVGANGGEGQWVYIYNFGGGWNGPIATPLAGNNDFAYVRAAFPSNNDVAIVGQLYEGLYPNGTFRAAVAEFTLGQTPVFTALDHPAPDAPILSGADIRVEPGTGARHVLAVASGGSVAYYHRPGGASWQDHTGALYSFENTYRARFLEPDGGPLHVIRGGSSGGGMSLVRAPDAVPDAPVDWAMADEFEAPLPPNPGFDAPTAIYVESRAYQTSPVGFNYAFCGQFMVADHEIWHGRAVE